jgi:hypothetical protein
MQALHLSMLDHLPMVRLLRATEATTPPWRRT